MFPFYSPYTAIHTDLLEIPLIITNYNRQTWTIRKRAKHNNIALPLLVLEELIRNSNSFLQVVVESSSSALEYADLTIEEGSPVNQDLHFDAQLMHLYVMTERKVRGGLTFFYSISNIMLIYRSFPHFLFPINFMSADLTDKIWLWKLCRHS